MTIYIYYTCTYVSSLHDPFVFFLQSVPVLIFVLFTIIVFIVHSWEKTCTDTCSLLMLRASCKWRKLFHVDFLNCENVLSSPYNLNLMPHERKQIQVWVRCTAWRLIQSACYHFMTNVSRLPTEWTSIKGMWSDI